LIYTTSTVIVRITVIHTVIKIAIWVAYSKSANFFIFLLKLLPEMRKAVNLSSKAEIQRAVKVIPILVAGIILSLTECRTIDFSEISNFRYSKSQFLQYFGNIGTL